MKIDISLDSDDLRYTNVCALRAYICSLADKIKENAYTSSYFKSRDVPHGEFPAPFEADIEELYRACIHTSNVISNTTV